MFSTFFFFAYLFLGSVPSNSIVSGVISQVVSWFNYKHDSLLNYFDIYLNVQVDFKCFTFFDDMLKKQA